MALYLQINKLIGVLTFPYSFGEFGHCIYVHKVTPILNAFTIRYLSLQCKHQVSDVVTGLL